MIVDVHGHLLPPDLLAEICKGCVGASPPAAPNRGRWHLRDCLCRQQAVAGDHEALERRCGTSRLNGKAGYQAHVIGGWRDYMIGADRVMMGSDMPFLIGDEEPAEIVLPPGSNPMRSLRSLAGLRKNGSPSDEWRQLA
jgi:hypothetical protein